MLEQPTIAFGSFSADGREVLPGHSGDIIPGYGILNQPNGFFGVVRDNPDDSDLREYLSLAHRKWDNLRRYHEVANSKDPFQFLVGLKISDFNAEGRGRLEVHVLDVGYIYFDYPTCLLTTAMMSPAQIREATLYHERKVLSVTYDAEHKLHEFELEGDIRFVIAALYPVHAHDPMVRVTDNNTTSRLTTWHRAWDN